MFVTYKVIIAWFDFIFRYTCVCMLLYFKCNKFSWFSAFNEIIDKLLSSLLIQTLDFSKYEVTLIGMKLKSMKRLRYSKNLSIFKGCLHQKTVFGCAIAFSIYWMKTKYDLKKEYFVLKMFIKLQNLWHHQHCYTLKLIFNCFFRIVTRITTKFSQKLVQLMKTIST